MKIKRGQIGREKWEELLSAFREHPKRSNVVARVTGVDYKTARRAWEQGWPNRDLPPIRNVIEEEQAATRAALLEARGEAEAEHERENIERVYEEKEKARQQAIETRKEEADMVRGGRANVIGLLGVVGQVLHGAMQDAPKIRDAIIAGKDPATGKVLSLRERLDLMIRTGRLIRMATESADDLIKLERLLVGEPTQILGLQDLDSFSEDEVIRELIEAGKMADRMRRRQALRLRLIPGGKGDDEEEDEPAASEGS